MPAEDQHCKQTFLRIAVSAVLLLFLHSPPPWLALGHSVFTIKLILLAGRTPEIRVRLTSSTDFRGLRLSQLKQISLIVKVYLKKSSDFVLKFSTAQLWPVQGSE